jgi:hypothetical protein
MKSITIALMAILLVCGVSAAMVHIPDLYKLNGRETIQLCAKTAIGDDGVAGTADDWQCSRTMHAPYGSVTYSVSGGKLYVDLRASRVKADAGTVYQLTLNGDGKHNIDTVLAGLGANAYESGMWGTEGYWNFKTAVVPKSSQYRCNSVTQGGIKSIVCDYYGSLYVHYELDLPDGLYENVKFIVKEVRGVDEANPYGTSWIPVLMEETQPLNFVVANP